MNGNLRHYNMVEVTSSPSPSPSGRRRTVLARPEVPDGSVKRSENALASAAGSMSSKFDDYSDVSSDEEEPESAPEPRTAVAVSIFDSLSAAADWATRFAVGHVDVPTVPQLVRQTTDMEILSKHERELLKKKSNKQQIQLIQEQVDELEHQDNSARKQANNAATKLRRRRTTKGRLSLQPSEDIQSEKTSLVKRHTWTAGGRRLENRSRTWG